RARSSPTAEWVAESHTMSALLPTSFSYMHLQTRQNPAVTAPSPFRRFSVAPMMDWTDRHCRYFLRQLSRNALLYTEMVTTGALINGDAARFLRYDEAEHPLALQLGGSVPADLATCARMA